MNLNQLASKQNLELAWRRITTGGNQQYKRFYRELYYAYEVSLKDNLEDLHSRLIGGAFEANQPDRIYIPKISGLHRPLTLLYIEDQIVLQAFANLAAKRLFKKRKELQFKHVFSNILENETSIFFFRRWQETYSAFQHTIQKHYKGGLRWIADFDLAAFYDTISHELLIKTIYPKTQLNGDMAWFLKCLSTWSSGSVSSSHGHGLPQGPLASDFLAECFLLPIDIALNKQKGYTRYVDDVRLFGRTENEVRATMIDLERHCRERGLIPQSGKFMIKRAQSIREAQGMLPSIADPQRTSGANSITKAHARRLFLSGIKGRPYRVKDKTRVRYVLFHSEPDSFILNKILRLIPHHPEHTDAFFSYIGKVSFRKPILRLCLDLIDSSPYPYVRGEAWHVLSRYLDIPYAINANLERTVAQRAVQIAKKRRSEYLMEKWGACHFLLAYERIRGHRLSRFIRFQTPLLQALLAPVLPDSAFESTELATSYLKRSAFEPGLSICGKIHGLSLTPDLLGIKNDELPSQVRNTLCQLGVIQSRGCPVDPIAEMLENRYSVSPLKSWQQVLGNEYVHALGLLKIAEASFNSGPSYWLAYQNSFNHCVFLSLQRHLNAIGSPAACTIIGKNGHLVDFGVMLERTGRFSQYYPQVADCFREMNERRNHLPGSHPYEKKTALRCTYLKKQERNRFVNRLSTAYSAIATLIR